jgi:hypothetical protein
MGYGNSMIHALSFNSRVTMDIARARRERVGNVYARCLAYVAVEGDGIIADADCP